MQSWWSRNVAGARAVFVSMTHYTNCLTELDPSKRRKEIHTHTHKPHRTTPHTYPSWEATHRQWWISKTKINCLGIQLKCSLLLKAWGVWTGRHSASQSCWERRMSPRPRVLSQVWKRYRLDTEIKAVLFRSGWFSIRLGCSLEY